MAAPDGPKTMSAPAMNEPGARSFESTTPPCDGGTSPGARFQFQDPALPGLNAVLEPNIVLAASRPWLPTSAATTSTRITDIRYKPRTNCLVAYEIETPTDRLRLYARTLRPEFWPRQIRRWQHEPPEHQRRSAIAPDGSFELFVWPADRRLKSLERWSRSPDWLLKRWLDPAVFSSGSSRHLRLLSWRPERRAVFAIESGTNPVAVAKIHDPRSFQRVLEIARAIRDVHSSLVPKLIGRSKRHGLLLHDWQPGRTPSTVPDSPTATASRFRWLARTLDMLGRVSPGSLSKWSHKTELDQANRLAKLACQLMPCAESLVQTTMQRLEASLNSDMRYSFCHGDLHWNQLLVDGDDVRLCDFDRALLGPADLDLANFVAHDLAWYIQSSNWLGGATWPYAQPLQCDGIAAMIEGGRALTRSQPGVFDGLLAARIAAISMQPFRRGCVDWPNQMTALWQIAHDLVAPNERTCMGAQTGKPAGETRAIERDVEISAPTGPPRIELAIRTDRQLDLAPELLEPDKFADRLRTTSGELQQIADQYDVAGIHVRRHKPGRRCLLEYQMVHRGDARVQMSLMAKAHWRKLDRRSMDLQKRLVRDFQMDGSCPDRPRVPRPIGAIHEWRIWFQEFCPGQMLTTQLQDDPDDLVFLAGIALGKIHQCSLVVDRQHTLEDERRILNQNLQQAANAFPGESSRIEDLQRRLGGWMDRLGTGDTVLLHRDFYPDQILVEAPASAERHRTLAENRQLGGAGEQESNGPDASIKPAERNRPESSVDQSRAGGITDAQRPRLTIVDWDLAAMGDASIDVGNFMAHLRERAIRKSSDPNRFARLEHRFLAGYRRVRWIDDRAVAIMTIVSLARHLGILLRKPKRVSIWPQLLEYLEAQVR